VAGVILANGHPGGITETVASARIHERHQQAGSALPFRDASQLEGS
jgi:hypothetical protein